MLRYKFIQLVYPVIPTKVGIHFHLPKSPDPSLWRRLQPRQHSCLDWLNKIKSSKLKFAWIPPCRARWLLHKPTIAQARSQLHETPATAYAGMTELRKIPSIC